MVACEPERGMIIIENIRSIVARLSGTCLTVTVLVEGKLFEYSERQPSILPMLSDGRCLQWITLLICHFGSFHMQSRLQVQVAHLRRELCRCKKSVASADLALLRFFNADFCVLHLHHPRNTCPRWVRFPDFSQVSSLFLWLQHLLYHAHSLLVWTHRDTYETQKWIART